MPLADGIVRVGLAFAVSGLACVSAQQACENLTRMQLDHATVVSSAMMESGPYKKPAGFPITLPDITVPRHCEVKGVARPTSDSEIKFELWMPPPEAWNGKYLQRGNGGWAGSIPSFTMIGPLARGYATSGTDNGHSATGMAIDANWAIGHPEKLIDFGYRSLHETALHSKAILQAYYGKAAERAYFAGCSDGGREALTEAQRYPEDFDGIVAGAPANYWSHHLTGMVWNEKALLEKPDSNIPVAKLAAIQKAALSSCDTVDGVKDGLIEDPRRCHFDPAVLKCSGTDGPDCLTEPQIEALRKIYSGPKNPRTGEQIYPGYEPGTEADGREWATWIVGAPHLQFLFGNSYYSGAVFENPKWDWRTIDFDRDLRIADEKTASILNAYNPDLRTFRARGGKLIQYHGWGDAAIAPRDSINFYEKVTAFLDRYPDPRSHEVRNVQSFYRLFMVPGMGHCQGGPGPTNFGNELVAGNPVADAEHDVLVALDRWVTQGIAPDKLIGTGKVGANPQDGSGGTPLTRPLCAYPAVARYKGQGDTNRAENFECATAP